ncbi:MAG: hypothetical protein IJO39_08125 [Clostridia bacterium]|nr:hypothetical protein [Clostridia bacterium]
MLHDDNERLLTLISEYLTFTPGAIKPADVTALAADCSLPLNDAYMALLAAHCGLDTSLPEDARLYRGYFPQMVRQHDPAVYEADAYFQAVKPLVGANAAIDLVYERIEPMELFVADDFRVDSEGRVLPQLGWFDGAFEFPAIREDGRVWMTVTPNEINTIQPAVHESRGRVLTYGLGLGYYAFHCLLKDDVESVTVVERNPAVIDMFRRHLLPFFPRQEALHIVQADAFDYAANIMPHEGFDTVFTDLWHDVADGLPLYQQMKPLEVPGPRYLYWIEQTLKCYMA